MPKMTQREEDFSRFTELRRDRTGLQFRAFESK